MQVDQTNSQINYDDLNNEFKALDVSGRSKPIDV
jgi:hypothetical protein